MARLMIFVEHPRHVSSEEAELWLLAQLEELRCGGSDTVQLRRLASLTLRFSDTWSWMLEFHCRDADAARDVLHGGAGLALIADLRLLGMRPSIVLVEDGV